MKLHSLAFACLIAASSSIQAQTCATYKGQLENLLALPAGNYRIDGFYAKVPARAVRQPNGQELPFDGLSIERENRVRVGEPVSVETYLDYKLPIIRSKVTDSTTQGRRKINGRLACQYEVSTLDPQGSRQFEMDVEISDSGRAKFFVKTPLSSDDPTSFLLVTDEIGRSAVAAIVTAALRKRDAAKPELSQNAEKVYSERLAKAQAGQDSQISRFREIEAECKDLIAKGREAIRMKDEGSHGAYYTRFLNAQCRQPNLQYPPYPNR